MFLFGLSCDIIMAMDTETLVAGLLCLCYAVYGPLVKGGFWKQNWTNKQGRWVSYAEGPLFFISMIVLFLALGVVLVLEGLNVL